MSNGPSCFEQAIDAAKRGGKAGVVMVGTPGVMVGAVVAGPPGIFIGGGLGTLVGGAGGVILGGGGKFVACQLAEVISPSVPTTPTSITIRHR